LQAVAAALTDAVGWRSLGFLTLHAVLMTPIGYFVLVGVAMSAVMVSSPVVWLAFGEPFISFGEPVDSLWAYLLLAVAGVVALYLLGWVMLGFSRAHVWLARPCSGRPSGGDEWCSWNGPAPESSTIQPPHCGASSVICTTVPRRG
jgi:Putative sensor